MDNRKFLKRVRNGSVILTLRNEGEKHILKSYLCSIREGKGEESYLVDLDTYFVFKLQGNNPTESIYEFLKLNDEIITEIPDAHVDVFYHK